MDSKYLHLAYIYIKIYTSSIHLHGFQIYTSSIHLHGFQISTFSLHLHELKYIHQA